MALMPGASRTQKFSGNRHKATIDKVCIHTTEGSNWPGYSGGRNAPHVTLKHTGAIRQHIDSAYSAKALENDSGGVETNNDGVLQVECIGSCDRAYARKHDLFFWPDADDDDLAPLAEFLAWAHTEHGVPLTARSLVWSDSNAAYETAPQRMSYAQWRGFSGVCGHQHVPENSHWDPGKLPVERAITLARRLVNAGAVPSPGTSAPAPAATKAPAFPLPRRKGAMYYYGLSSGPITSVSGRTLNTAVPADVIKRAGRWMSQGLAKWQARMIERGWSELSTAGGADGRFGDVTEKVVRQFQEVMGLTVDGKIGPETYAAAWEEPVK